MIPFRVVFFSTWHHLGNWMIFIFAALKIDDMEPQNCLFETMCFLFQVREHFQVPCCIRDIIFPPCAITIWPPFQAEWQWRDERWCCPSPPRSVFEFFFCPRAVNNLDLWISEMLGSINITAIRDVGLINIAVTSIHQLSKRPKEPWLWMRKKRCI